MKTRTCLALLALFLGVGLGVDAAAGQETIPAKQVAAPPQDIAKGVLRLPAPATLGVTSRSALIEIDPAWADEDNVVRLGLPIALGDGHARVVFMPAQPDAWVGVLTPFDADGTQNPTIRTNTRAELPGVSRVQHPLPWGNDARAFDAITLPPDRAMVQVEIELREPVGGYLLIDPRPDRALTTFVEQHSTLVGRPITLANTLSDGSAIVRLHAVIRSPEGRRTEIQADPGSSRLTFTPTTPGTHAVHVYAEYADTDNRPVVLTTQHAIEVESPAAPLGRTTTRLADRRVEFRFADDPASRRAILAAEVWGLSQTGMVPVCWLARVCDAERSLFLDPRWIALAGVDPATLELRAVRLHDVDSLVPLEVVDRVALDMPEVALPPVPERITPDMLHGFAPIPVAAPAGFRDTSARASLPGGHRLLLVHGYCSDGNPFPTSQFSGDLAVFNDPNVSRSQDAFALQILSQTAPMKSFGVAGHSQGGMAALHLFTFYFSGLDWARGDRLIQTVGAPWQGTPLAGNAAVLGDIFGFGCGVNTDLAPAGAVNWLSLIPTSSRQLVWYYTTSFEDRPFAFDFCNIVTDILLSDPDDGVIERTRGQLPGGNNMGHVTGWCHTEGMRDPAQCTDASRNAIINARARR